MTARYDTVRELHDKLGPSLDIITEMALLDPSQTEQRRALLRTVVNQCCGALVQVTPHAHNVRAAVFELRAKPDVIAPVGHFGRREQPRTFRLNAPEGRELRRYLESSNPRGEIYADTKVTVPDHYSGDPARYRTFIRAPIYTRGVAFGMVTIDAPSAGALNEEDISLVELVAATLTVAFATAAG